MTRKQLPLVSFGLLSDVQYADVIDGWDFHHICQRYYRQALIHLAAIVGEWTRVAQQQPDIKLRFAVNLGDLIDGKNKPAGTSQAALAQTKAAWIPFQRDVGPVHHLLGNHELYNLSPKLFQEELLYPHIATANTSDDGGRACYYAFEMEEAPQFRFIVLNSYGLSVLGRDAADPIAQEAQQLLCSVNPNANLNSPEGLEGDQQRFVAFNGAIEQTQLRWLEETLTDCEKRKQHAILYMHIPIQPKATAYTSLLWNYEEVLAVINRFTCVRVVFAGHTHVDGYYYDEEHGVHYMVCDAILECAPTETAHAIVEVHNDRLVVNGYGKIPSRELVFP